MMTSTIRKFGVGVASLALVASATAPAFAADLREVPGPMDGIVNTGRLGGFDRIDTAIKIAEAAFADTSDNVEVAYIAGAADTAAVDSAAAGHLSDGPLYLVAGDNRSQDAVAKSINEKYPNVQKVIAIGGESVVSSATLKGIADKIDNVTKTDRVSGKDRYETAAAIAEYGSTHNGLDEGNQFINAKLKRQDAFRSETVDKEIGQTKVYLARGDNPVDALVSGVLDDAPVLLLGPDGSVPEATAAYLKKHLPTHFVALGGTKAVPTDSFMKADFNPLMQNIWLNNEMVAKARADKNVAEQLLNGIENGVSVNPNHLPAKGWEAKSYNAGNGVDIAQLQAEVSSLVNEKTTKENQLTTKPGATASQKQAAEAKAKTAAVYAQAVADLAAYYGDPRSTGTYADTARNKKGTANYSGSWEAYKRAEVALDDFNTAQEIPTEITNAVLTYGDEITKARGVSADEVKAAKKLQDVIKKYMDKFYSVTDTTDTAVTAVVDKANGDHFVATWNTAAIKDSLKGFMTATGTTTAANDDHAYSPVADYADGAATTKYQVEARELTNRTALNDALGETAGTHNKAGVYVPFAGLNAISKLNKSTLENDKETAKVFMDADIKTLNDNYGEDAYKDPKALLDKVVEDYINDTANNTDSDVKAYQDANAARKAVEDEIAGLDEQLVVKRAELASAQARVGKTDAFKGYVNIEKDYSSLSGYYAGLLNVTKQEISLEVSKMVNNAKAGVGNEATPDQVVANDTLKSLILKGFGQELNTDSVKSFFTFRKNAQGYQQVHSLKVAGVADKNNNISGKAVAMVNEFYAEMDKQSGRFDNTEMRDWFAASPVAGKGHYTQLDSYRKADDSAKALARAAAVVIGEALERHEVLVGKVGDVSTGAQDSVARVAAYLHSVAKGNREAAASNLLKATVALQQALDKVLPKRYDRIDGVDRYQTSAAIAGYWRASFVFEGGTYGERFSQNLNIYLANGISYIDAVAGGQLKNGPIVLVAPDGKLTDAVKQRFAWGKTDAKVLTITALGGSKVVSDQALVDAKAAAFDKSLRDKNFFSDATNKAVDNAKDKDEKKADEKKADEKKADDKK